MAKLITKIARDGKLGREFELQSSGPKSAGRKPDANLVVHTQKDVIVESQPIDDDQSSNRSHTQGIGIDNDERPLKDGWRMGATATVTTSQH